MIEEEKEFKGDGAANFNVSKKFFGLLGNKKNELLNLIKRRGTFKIGDSFPECEPAEEAISSSYGELTRHPLIQVRDGKSRWMNEDGSVVITVDSQSNLITEIAKGQTQPFLED